MEGAGFSDSWIKDFHLFNIFSADLGQHGRKVWMVDQEICLGFVLAQFGQMVDRNFCYFYGLD